MSKNNRLIRIAASALKTIGYAIALILTNSLTLYIVAVPHYDVATKAFAFIITAVYDVFMAWFITDNYYHTNYYAKLYAIKDNIIMARLELTEAEINLESALASSSTDSLMGAVYEHIKSAKKLLDEI
jgi:glucose-6-phosphate-specific signal transduction histidine kinase